MDNWGSIVRLASFETNRISGLQTHKSVESPTQIDWFRLPFDVSARIEYCSMSKKGMMPGGAGWDSRFLNVSHTPRI